MPELWTLGRMSTSRKTSTLESILGLMIISGFMLLICALPLGVVVCLQDRYEFHEDWPWAIGLGVVMAGASAIVGGMLFGVGEFVVRRQHMRDGSTIHHDAA